MSYCPGSYVYLIKEREFVRTNDPVLKVGRSRNIMDRLRAYPIGSVLLSCWFVHDDAAAERAVLKAFLASPDKCTRRTDLGKEWFMARSPECEKDLVDLYGHVVLDVIRKQGPPPHRPL